MRWYRVIIEGHPKASFTMQGLCEKDVMCRVCCCMGFKGKFKVKAMCFCN